MKIRSNYDCPNQRSECIKHKQMNKWTDWLICVTDDGTIFLGSGPVGSVVLLWWVQPYRHWGVVCDCATAYHHQKCQDRQGMWLNITLGFPSCLVSVSISCCEGKIGNVCFWQILTSHGFKFLPTAISSSMQQLHNGVTSIMGTWWTGSAVAQCFSVVYIEQYADEKKSRI